MSVSQFIFHIIHFIPHKYTPSFIDSFKVYFYDENNDDGDNDDDDDDDDVSVYNFIGFLFLLLLLPSNKEYVSVFMLKSCQIIIIK